MKEMQYNNIDDALESKFRGRVNRNEKLFNEIDDEDWEENYQDLYEYILNTNND